MECIILWTEVVVRKLDFVSSKDLARYWYQLVSCTSDQLNIISFNLIHSDSSRLESSFKSLILTYGVLGFWGFGVLGFV